MENNEMKEKNEEILNKWRNFGMLSGLKEGSINEWRCAKSYEEMAEYILSNYEGKHFFDTDDVDNAFKTNGSFDTIIFALIRRTLCTGKNRLCRIVHPEEIINALNNTMVKEGFDIVDKVIPIKGKTGLKYIGRKLTRNFAEKFCNSYFTYDNLSCLGMITTWGNEDIQEKIKFFHDITTGDFEAEMCAIFSEVIKYKLK